MKKSLIALAVLAASGAAMAQSSVTLFGVVDTGVRYVDGGNGGDTWSLMTSGNASTRLGFRGTEDLGGGLNASFWLEAGFNSDNGTGVNTSANNQIGTSSAVAASGTQGLTFNRRSTISLAGSWGELRLGRDYVPYFWNTTIFDPFGTNGVGSVSNFTSAGLSTLNFLGAGGTAGQKAALNAAAAGVRASNSIGYFLPDMSGFYGQAMYAFGENSNRTCTGPNSTVCSNNPDSANGNVGSVRVGYANGPFDVAVGWGQTTFAPSQQYFVTNIGASWNFGVAKASFLWNQEAADTGSLGLAGVGANQTLRSNTYMLGAIVPLGAGEIKGSYTWGNSTNDGLKGYQIALGYVYNLSKRTALYTTYSYINNDGKLAVYNLGTNPGLNNNTFGLDFGVRHSF